MENDVKTSDEGYAMSNRHRRGFTLVELLVVIGIIALLIGILIPVVANVRKSAYVANTKNLMQKISAAITSYQLVFRSAPGVMPNLAYDFDYTSASPAPVAASTQFVNTGGEYNYFTQSEDVVVALCGGLTKDFTTANSKLNYDSKYLGQGPTSFNPLNPDKKTAFIAADPADLSPPDVRLGDLSNGLNQGFVKDTKVPEFMDKFPEGRAIIYARANPGAANGSATTAATIISPGYNPAYHYNYKAIAPYLNFDDANEPLNNKKSPTILPEVNSYFTSEQSSTTAKYAGTYILISAGADRKFGTADDIISGGGGGQ
jgi:prepilin-type N-terminal cleavage/methylation domain-containing protein